MADYCTIVKSSQVIKEFVATVTIPIGFKIIGDGNDPRYPYKDYISMDRGSIETHTEEQMFPSVISIPDPQDPTQTITLNCQSRARVIKLEGPLFYTVVVAGFMPVLPVEPQTQTDIVVTVPTAFTANNTIQIMDAIGYTCYECQMSPEILANYKLEIIQKDEFIITSNGNIIFHRAEEPQDFFAELDGKNTVTINYPLMLILTPLDPVTV